MKKIVGILCIVLCCVSFASAQKRLSGKIEGNKREFMIGDRIEYSFSAPKPNFETVLSTDYAFSDTLSLISQHTDTTGKEITYSFVFASFVEGEIALPEYSIYKQSTTQALYSFSAPTIKIKVPEIDTLNIEVKELKAIEKVPVTFGEILPVCLLAVLCVAVVLAAVYLIRYLRKRRENRITSSVKQTETIPEDIEALKSLDILRQAHYIENNQTKQHYILLTDIVWKYIFRRFGINAFEMTSQQIVEALQEEQVGMENIERMRYLFFVADLVKFAKHQPSINENIETMQKSKDFVLDTKRIIAEKQENSKEKEEEIL